MKSQESIIAAKVKSLYVQDLCRRKGWSDQHAAYLVVEFLCTPGVNFFEFMEKQSASI